jgi:hypothetical protein
MAFWSDSLQQLSEIAVTFQLQTCRESANPSIGGVVAYRYILGRAGSACHASGMIAVVIDDQKGAQP